MASYTALSSAAPPNANGQCWFTFSGISHHEPPAATESSAALAPASPVFVSSLHTTGLPNSRSAWIRAGMSSGFVALK
jgi:hypothetical protein